MRSDAVLAVEMRKQAPTRPTERLTRLHHVPLGWIHQRAHLFLWNLGFKQTQWNPLNPLSPNIKIQILQTDLHTFPLRIS